MAARDPEVRAIVSAMGGHASALKSPDRKQKTAAATKASPVTVQYWAAIIDPEQKLDEKERLGRATSALGLYRARLSLLGVQARRAKQAERKAQRRKAENIVKAVLDELDGAA